jgi:hypothetical protein
MRIFLLLIILINFINAKSNFFIKILIDINSSKNINSIKNINKQIDIWQGGITFTERITLKDIKKHKYKVIINFIQAKQLKNMTTYVLLPNNISISNSYNKSKKYKRYKKVLNLIQELPKYDENISKLDDKKINKFILLAKEKALEDEPITPKNYNYKLSNLIIYTIENNSTLSFKSEGPFLVTTMNNIITDKNITYLYIDLSEFNNSAIDEIINSYKQHLIDKGNSDFTILEKLKYKILALLTNANDNIHIVKSAVAGGIE